MFGNILTLGCVASLVLAYDSDDAIEVLNPSPLECTGPFISAGFHANFYSYPTFSSAGESDTYFLQDYKKVGKLVGSVDDVENINFEHLSPSNDILVYGFSTPNNFALELTGYLLAPQTGDYTFTLANNKDGVGLQIGQATGASCCADKSSIFSQEVFINRWSDAYTVVSRNYSMVGGSYYPIRLMFYNSYYVSTLNVTVTLPDGSLQTRYGNVHQLASSNLCPKSSSKLSSTIASKSVDSIGPHSSLGQMSSYFSAGFISSDKPLSIQPDRSSTLQLASSSAVSIQSKSLLSHTVKSTSNNFGSALITSTGSSHVSRLESSVKSSKFLTYSSTGAAPPTNKLSSNVSSLRHLRTTQIDTIISTAAQSSMSRESRISCPLDVETPSAGLKTMKPKYSNSTSAGRSEHTSKRDTSPPVRTSFQTKTIVDCSSRACGKLESGNTKVSAKSTNGKQASQITTVSKPRTSMPVSKTSTVVSESSSQNTVSVPLQVNLSIRGRYSSLAVILAVAGVFVL